MRYEVTFFTFVSLKIKLEKLGGINLIIFLIVSLDCYFIFDRCADASEPPKTADGAEASGGRAGTRDH